MYKSAVFDQFEVQAYTPEAGEDPKAVWALFGHYAPLPWHNVGGVDFLGAFRSKRHAEELAVVLRRSLEREVRHLVPRLPKVETHEVRVTLTFEYPVNVDAEVVGRDVLAQLATFEPVGPSTPHPDLRALKVEEESVIYGTDAEREGAVWTWTPPK